MSYSVLVKKDDEVYIVACIIIQSLKKTNLARTKVKSTATGTASSVF